MLKTTLRACREDGMHPATPVPSRRRTTRRRGLLVAAVAAILTLGLSACTPEAYASFDMINSSRWQAGRAPLDWNQDLWFKAQGWADQLARDGYLHHSYLPDGLGHLPWRKLGENVGVSSSIAGMHNAFMASTGHRNNILDSAFNFGAVGVTRDIFGRYWVVQEFMRL
jgi:uncharacterized protein YkwD